jgi:signal transduction histidine kinase
VRYISKKGKLNKQENRVKNREDMDYQDIYNVLEKEFQDTFIEELVPGIVHNFANPLNGIMGRSRLLQRKLMEIMKRIDAEKDSSYIENNQKLVRDVDSIAREADRLSGLLQNVTGKFCAISDRNIQKINLSELIELEMKFFDFYLDFKHSIKKTVQLDREIPEVKGSSADYSLALSALIRYSINMMKESAAKELYISTQFENGNVCIKIKNQGIPVSEDQKKLLLEESQTDISSLEIPGGIGLLCAFSLLKKWGAHSEIKSESGVNTITVLIPAK